jgi:hypothetical protein
MSVSTKHMRQQNVGACAEASPYCFNPAKSAVAGFSQTSSFSCSPSWRCCPLLMQSPSVVLLLAALLVWTNSLLHYTGSFVPARHAETSQTLASTKYWCPPRFHWFLSNFSSQYLCSQVSFQKLVKARSNHPHCPISVFLLMISIQRPSQRSAAWPLRCPKWGMGALGGGRKGGGGRAIVFITSRWGRAMSIHAPHLFLALNPPSVMFPPGLSFAFLLAAYETFDNIFNLYDPNK